MMYDYTDKMLTMEAKRLNFVKNTLEKEYRLLSILEFINNNSDLNNMIALKGGTAINLCLLDLPRLSVDLDFDLCLDCSREEMLEQREKIYNIITNHMKRNRYYLSEKSKFVHSLDSFRCLYDTTSNSSDQIKLDINYSDRLHVLPLVKKKTTSLLKETIEITILNPLEIIGSKVNALFTRTVMRDIYDMYNLIEAGIIEDNEIVKKIALFYICISSDIPVNIDEIIEEAKRRIRSSIFQDYKETIVPVIHKGVYLEIERIKTVVLKYLDYYFVLTGEEKEFVDKFNKGIFDQKLLFGDYECSDLSKHPMVLWKLSNLL